MTLAAARTGMVDLSQHIPPAPGEGNGEIRGEERAGNASQKRRNPKITVPLHKKWTSKRTSSPPALSANFELQQQSSPSIALSNTTSDKGSARISSLGSGLFKSKNEGTVMEFTRMSGTDEQSDRVKSVPRHQLQRRSPALWLPEMDIASFTAGSDIASFTDMRLPSTFSFASLQSKNNSPAWGLDPHLTAPEEVFVDPIVINPGDGRTAIAVRPVLYGSVPI